MRTTPSPAARRGPSRDVVRAADRPNTHRSRLRADRVGPRTAAALIAIELIAGCSDSGTIVEPASQSEFADPGPYPVAEFDVTLVDPSRPTRPNRTFPGTPDRTLIARVWFPTDGATGAIGDAAPVPAPGGPFPLIVYSHGYVSARVEATDLARHLASHGYVVVAPDYPLGNGGAPGGPTLADLAMQPGDLGFVMDGVARLPGKYGALSAAIDGSNRGIAGLSMGGATTLIACPPGSEDTAFLRDLRDVALLLVGRDLLARREELVALQAADVTESPAGDGSATATIRRSKTDAAGEGADQYVSPEAFAALRRWCKAAGISTGPVFRSMKKGGRVTDRALGAGEVPGILKRLARRAGLPDDRVVRIAGHSLRVGMAADLVAGGADLPALMQAGRWRSPAMPAMYARKLLAGRGAVAQYHARRRA